MRRHIAHITGMRPNAMDKVIGPYLDETVAKMQAVRAIAYSEKHGGDWSYRIYELDFENLCLVAVSGA